MTNDQEIRRAVAIIAKALKERREKDRLSFRDVEAVTGVSCSTLSRIENLKGKPDAHTIAKLCDFLNLPGERVLNADDQSPVIYYPDEGLPEIVDEHLVKDKNLTPEDAARLSEIFRAAYNQISKFGKNQSEI